MYGRKWGEGAWRGEAYQLVIASSPAASSPSAEIAPLSPFSIVCAHTRPMQSLNAGGDCRRLPCELNRCRKWKKSKWVNHPAHYYTQAAPWCVCTQGLNKSTWTCDIWRTQWAFYSLLIHPDNNSLCGRNAAQDVRTGLEKCHHWFICGAQLNHALFNMESLIMKENTQTAQTFFVCFDSATLDTGERHSCVISVIFCRNENNFFSSPSSFRPPHILWGCPCESHWSWRHKQTNMQ